MFLYVFDQVIDLFVCQIDFQCLGCVGIVKCDCYVWDWVQYYVVIVDGLVGVDGLVIDIEFYFVCQQYFQFCGGYDDICVEMFVGFQLDVGFGKVFDVVCDY